LLCEGVRTGVLPESMAETLEEVDIWADEERTMVVEISGEPRRLVLDEILGWQWYNSEGPEE